MPHPPFLCQLVCLLVPNTTQHSTIQLKPKQRPTIGVSSYSFGPVVLFCKLRANCATSLTCTRLISIRICATKRPE